MRCLDDAQIDCAGEKFRLKGLGVIIVATVMLASSLLLAAGGTLSQAFAAENAALAPSAVPMAAQSGGTVEFDTVDIASSKGSVVWNATTNTITLKNASINMGKQSEAHRNAQRTFRPHFLHERNLRRLRDLERRKRAQHAAKRAEGVSGHVHAHQVAFALVALGRGEWRAVRQLGSGRILRSRKLQGACAEGLEGLSAARCL